MFEADVPIVGLPATLDGLRILHLSDAHFGSRWVAAYDRALETIASLRVDLIAFTGDWIENKLDFRPGLPTAIRFARGLRSKFGTFGIIGNHDGDLLAPRLIDAGITVLVGETRRIVGGDASIEIVGLPGVDRDDLSDAFVGTHAPPSPGTFRLLLGHYPDQVRRVACMRPHLMLAGHTHGGQVCLPGGWPILKHDSLPRRQIVGLHAIDDVWLHTSRGLGCSQWNVRVFCPPEMTVLTLKSGRLRVESGEI